MTPFFCTASEASLQLDRRAQRKSLRAARAALGVLGRRQASQRIAATIARTVWLAGGRRIALYLALPEEIDTAPLLELALRRRCAVFLPQVLDYRRRRMAFVAPGRRLRRNRHGIIEFPGGTRAAPWTLQRVFLPLVGFDAHGTRLGMGAGFYDRALAFRRRRGHWRGPWLVGIAHSCQEVPLLERLPTDIPLDAIVTERGIRVFRGAFP